MLGKCARVKQGPARRPFSLAGAARAAAGFFVPALKETIMTADRAIKEPCRAATTGNITLSVSRPLTESRCPPGPGAGQGPEQCRQ